MDIELQRQQIIIKFKRNGHNLNTNSLERVLNYLNCYDNQIKCLDNLVKKVNEISINSQNASNKNNLIKQAIELLKLKNYKLRNFQDVIKELQKWCILYISPYQCNNSKFFIEKPQKEQFLFHANDKIEMNRNIFLDIYEQNLQYYKNNNNNNGTIFIGILFENYSQISKQTGKHKLMMQNQLNQIQIIFANNFQSECFIICGFTYIVKGNYYNKDLILTVDTIELPKPIKNRKQCLIHQKFIEICRQINHNKQSMQFTKYDFLKYNCLFNQHKDIKKIIIIFNNVTITKNNIYRIYNICKRLDTQCIIIMLSSGQHQNINISQYIKSTIFLIPNINSQGPRLLPKIPIMKYDFGVKILTNPARLLIYNKQVIFINYSLIQYLYSNNLFLKELDYIDSNQLIKSVSQFVFSQNNIYLNQNIFWKQFQYFKITNNNLLFISDSALKTIYYTNQLSSIGGGGGGLISCGNFQRDGQFVCFLPKISEHLIQFCQEPKN